MRTRLFLAFTAIIIITLAILGILVRNNTLDAVNDFAKRGGFIGAERLIFSLEEYYQTSDSWQDVEESFSPSADGQDHMGGQQGQGQGQGQMMNNPAKGMMDFYLVDPDGIFVYSPTGTVLPDPLTQEELAQTFPLHHHDEVIGYLVPQDNLPYFSNVFETGFSSLLTNTLLPTILIMGALALLLATLVGYFLLRPVRSLTTAAQSLANGNLSQRVDVQGKDELATLGTAFNHMASSLEQAENSRRAMTSDIAHELRTPLAVQRANIEALQDGVYPLSIENLAPLLEQNNLLAQLVEDLRTLAQSDSDTLLLEKHPRDLVKLLGHISDNFQPQASRQNVKLTFYQLTECPSIKLDERRITQVINNLVQNALQHTPEGGDINLALECLKSSVEITVRDTGPGIPENALDHIFERFFRVDQSRSRDKGSSGLGLTIARRLAEAHDGTLTAGNHPDGGALFTLTLPL